MLFIIIAVLLILGVYVITVYNKLQTLKTRIKAAIQEIGNQLKRQAELIPNLAESVKGYLKHEKDIFQKLTDARTQISQAAQSNDTKKMADAQTVLQKALGSLTVLVESNPELKASTTVNKLMNELRDTADKVMYSRRTLIDLVADYNQILVVFPSNLIAGMFKFKKETGLKVASQGEHLSVSSSETKTPKIKLD